MSLLSMAGMTNISSKSYEKYVLSLNPIGYWPLNESSGTTINDLSSSGYHGSIIPNTNRISYSNPPIRNGSAGTIGFQNNRTNKIHFPTNYTKMSSMMSNDSASTICLWIKLSNTDGGISSILRTGVGSEGARYTINSSGGMLQSPSGWFNPDNNSIAIPFNLISGKTYFYAWVKDSPSQLMYVFINGTYYWQTNPPFTMNQYNVGNSGINFADRAFAGSLSDIAMFDYKLSNEEIEQMYNLGKIE